MKDKVLSKANPISILCHSLRFQVFPEKGDVRSPKKHTGGRECWRLPRPGWESPTPTESPRVVWVERDLRDQPLPTPFQGLLQAPRPGLGLFQGWSSHSFPGKSIPGSHHRHGEGFLPKIPSKPTLWQREAAPRYSITPSPCPSPCPVLLEPL